ncbi:MAG: phage holin family protein [Solirubrobacterales bacterium]
MTGEGEAQVKTRAMPERPSRARRAVRILLVTAIETGGLYLMSAILPGVTITGLDGAFSAVVVIGLLNALLWPLITRLILPVFIWTLGFAALILNGLFVTLAADILPGFEVDSLAAGIITAVVLTVVNTVFSTLLAIDDEDSFYRRVVLRIARREKDAIRTDVPGVLFLEIDGLSIETMRLAAAAGQLPNLDRWMREGSHRVVPWECDLSSQTGASQAGLLHGNNRDMPAFRWYDKETGKVVTSNNPPDTKMIQDAISDGHGLLAGSGASRGNMFSGDATRMLFTLSDVMSKRRRSDAHAFFGDPYNFIRTLSLCVADVGYEIAAAARQRRRDVQPRVARGGVYILARAGTTVALRDLNIYTLIGDMFRGVPVAYATFLGYDEVAHHSGIERADTLDVLQRLDSQFGRLETAMSAAPRPYHLVILSDHGQSQGATFKQRYDETLEQLVQRNLSAGRVASVEDADEALAHLGGAATEMAEGGGGVGLATKTVTIGRRKDGTISFGPDDTKLEGEDGDEDGDDADDPPNAIVLASGCLGLIYLPGLPGRASLEQLDAAHPQLVSSLVEHPGVGFIMVRSESEGAVVLGTDGRRRLSDDEVKGADPLADFGPNAGMHLSRTDTFANAPDILFNSLFDPDTQEVAAFEELVGSHGGLGGPQSHPFALVPAGWAAPDDPIVGAGAMHRQMLEWLRSEGTVPARDGMEAADDKSGSDR